MWINHHRMFTHIKRSNDVLLVLNLLLLLGVTAVPFPTAVMAQHLGGPDERTAALVYNATFVAIAVAFNVLWRYAVSRHLLYEHAVSLRRTSPANMRSDRSCTWPVSSSPGSTCAPALWPTLLLHYSLPCPQPDEEEFSATITQCADYEDPNQAACGC